MDKYSEEYRHRCEVRELIRLRVIHGPSWLRGHLLDRRVDKRSKKLSEDVWKQWVLGNRGEEGMWIDD